MDKIVLETVPYLATSYAQQELTSGWTEGLPSIAAMEELTEMVSAEEMLCVEDSSSISTLLQVDSSTMTGVNTWKVMVSPTFPATHKIFLINCM